MPKNLIIIKFRVEKLRNCLLIKRKSVILQSVFHGIRLLRLIWKQDVVRQPIVHPVHLCVL